MPILLPYLKLDVNDWLTSQKIELMNISQIGAYIMLLTKCWRTETCTLPGDLVRLKQMSKWQDELGDFGQVVACFPPVKKPHGHVTNPRLYQEWLKARQQMEIFTVSGAKGAAKRWATKALTPREDNGALGRETWEAYAQAYRVKYHVDPVRNASVNSQIAQVVKRLGATDAPQVAAFYVTHNQPIYTGARHCTKLLLRDAEGLRTQWATGIKATTGESKNLEARDDARAQVKRVEAILKGGMS